MENVEALQARMAEVMAQVNALVDEGDALVAKINALQGVKPAQPRPRSAKEIKRELRKRNAAARASARGFFRA